MDLTKALEIFNSPLGELTVQNLETKYFALMNRCIHQPIEEQMHIDKAFNFLKTYLKEHQPEPTTIQHTETAILPSIYGNEAVLVTRSYTTIDPVQHPPPNPPQNSCIQRTDSYKKISIRLMHYF